MRRFWRDLDRLTRFVHLGLLPFDGHFDASFHYVRRLDARMSMARDDRSFIELYVHYDRLVARGRSVVTPLAVVGADAWANASVAENPARLQIAQPATPVKPRVVSMRFLPIEHRPVTPGREFWQSSDL
jgi:hypothetical protein